MSKKSSKRDKKKGIWYDSPVEQPAEETLSIEPEAAITAYDCDELKDEPVAVEEDVLEPVCYYDNKEPTAIEENITYPERPEHEKGKLYLLCIHCNNGGIVTYPYMHDISMVIEINPSVHTFQLTSCRDCVRRISFETGSDSTAISGLMKGVSSMHISTSFIMNSNMYCDITGSEHEIINITVQNGGIQYANTKDVYSSLTQGCTIQFYSNVNRKILDYMVAGFF